MNFFDFEKLLDELLDRTEDVIKAAKGSESLAGLSRTLPRLEESLNVFRNDPVVTVVLRRNSNDEKR